MFLHESSAKMANVKAKAKAGPKVKRGWTDSLWHIFQWQIANGKVSQAKAKPKNPGLKKATAKPKAK